MGTCIGKYNYKYFIGFLYSTSWLIFLSSVFLIDYLIVVTEEVEEEGNKGFIGILEKSGGVVFVLIYVFFV